MLLRIIKKDGSIAYVEEMGCPIIDGSRDDLLVGSFRDITDRKQGEKSLRQSEERLKLAMWANNDGIFDWDFLKPAFEGSNIMPMDIDGIVEERR